MDEIDDIDEKDSMITLIICCVHYCAFRLSSPFRPLRVPGMTIFLDLRFIQIKLVYFFLFFAPCSTTKLIFEFTRIFTTFLFSTIASI